MAARRQEKRHPGMKPNDLGIQIKFSCLALISLLFTTLALISLIVLVCISYVFKLSAYLKRANIGMGEGELEPEGKK